MSCFKLLDNLCEHIEGMISKFWWGSKQYERKIHWIAWKDLCKEKKEGGMSFKTLKDFNLAMLAKQGWRILHHEESLLALCLKSRYFPRCNFLQANLGFNPSFTLRSIFQARKEVIDLAGMWRIGDGRALRIWEDSWLPHQNGHEIWSPKPADVDLSGVYELIDEENGGWKTQLIQTLFFPFEAN